MKISGDASFAVSGCIHSERRNITFKVAGNYSVQLQFPALKIAQHCLATSLVAWRLGHRGRSGQSIREANSVLTQDLSCVCTVQNSSWCSKSLQWRTDFDKIKKIMIIMNNCYYNCFKLGSAQPDAGMGSSLSAADARDGGTHSSQTSVS